MADTVIGDYNDHMCSVGGTLRCRLFVAGADETPLHRYYCALLAPEVVHSEHEEDGLHWDIWLNNARMHGLVRQGKRLRGEGS